MKMLIGMFLMHMSIVTFNIFICGGEFDIKEKTRLFIAWTVFLMLLMSGIYLMRGE